jgi:hypothetical protein
MSRIRNRLARLEAKAKPAEPGKWHRVIGGTAAECEARRRAMIERGEAREADDFVFRLMVSAPAYPSAAASIYGAARVMDQRFIHLSCPSACLKSAREA